MNASLRIFLSYGHNANKEWVGRVSADRRKRGHDVGFDKTEIMAGDDWRRSITGSRERYLIVIDTLDDARKAGRNPLVEQILEKSEGLFLYAEQLLGTNLRFN